MFSVEFLMTSLVVVLIPGTGVIYTVSTGLFRGWKASVFAAAGCTAGIIPHLTASIVGLAAILHMSAVAFQAIKTLGVAYLLYLAWSMWRDSGAVRFEGGRGPAGALGIAVKGVLINILNPKLSLFFLAFLPQFIPAGSGSPVRSMLLLSAVFMGMTLIVFTLYGLCANAVRAYDADSPTFMRTVQRSFAVVFAGLAAKLAFAER